MGHEGMSQQNINVAENPAENKDVKQSAAELKQTAQELNTKVKEGNVQKLEPSKLKELWDKSKKLIFALGCFSTAAAGAAYGIIEGIAHQGDITSGGTEMAVGAAITLLFAAIGYTSLEK